MFGLFKKETVDYDAMFMEQYKAMNALRRQAQDEPDPVIRQSLLDVVAEKGRELVDLIDKGAAQDRTHFQHLAEQAEKEAQDFRALNEDL